MLQHAFATSAQSLGGRARDRLDRRLLYNCFKALFWLVETRDQCPAGAGFGCSTVPLCPDGSVEPSFRRTVRDLAERRLNRLPDAKCRKPMSHDAAPSS